MYSGTFIDKITDFAKEDLKAKNAEVRRASVDTWRIVDHSETVFTVAVRLRVKIAEVYEVWVNVDLQTLQMETR